MGISMKNLKGKNALLTGGSMGLGPYVAQSLAREGVNIALTARSQDKLEKVAEELRQFNVEVNVYPADIKDETSRIGLVEEVKKSFGHIDLLINNAGVEWISSFVDLTPDDIENLVQTNLMSPLMLTRAVLPDMLKRKSGHVVTMSSLGGKKGQPYSAPYAATKAGLIAWNSSIRAELRDTGVSASVICPGFVSNSGMFAIYNKKAPKISGESKPQDVGKAVIKAIKKDLQEVLVNPNSMLPAMLLDVINPAIMTSVFRKTGLHEFYRQQALDNMQQRHEKRS